MKGNLNPAIRTCLTWYAFSVLPSSRTRGNGHKSKCKIFRLPRETVESLSMERVTVCQDAVLGNRLLLTLLRGGGLNSAISRAACQPQPFCDFWVLSNIQ